MPVEFSAAAYRFGHRMVLTRVYSHNRIFDTRRRYPGNARSAVQVQRALGQHHRRPCAEPADRPAARYRYCRATGSSTGGAITNSRRLDTISRPPRAERRSSCSTSSTARSIRSPQRRMFHNLLGSNPGNLTSIALLNLKRGVILGLPCGEDVAKAMRMRNPLTPDEIANGPDGKVAEKHGLHRENAALVLHPQGGAAAQERRAARAGGFDYGGGSLCWARAW